MIIHFKKYYYLFEIRNSIGNLVDCREKSDYNLVIMAYGYNKITFFKFQLSY